MSDYDSADEWAAPTKPIEPAVQREQVDARQMEVQGDADEQALAGGVVPIRFILPDGTDFTRSFFMGQTIGYVKQQVEDIKGISFHKMTLKLGDKVLIDPLSLNDLPFTAGQEATVTVVVA